MIKRRIRVLPVAHDYHDDLTVPIAYQSFVETSVYWMFKSIIRSVSNIGDVWWGLSFSMKLSTKRWGTKSFRDTIAVRSGQSMTVMMRPLSRRLISSDKIACTSLSSSKCRKTGWWWVLGGAMAWRHANSHRQRAARNTWLAVRVVLRAIETTEGGQWSAASEQGAAAGQHDMTVRRPHGKSDPALRGADLWGDGVAQFSCHFLPFHTHFDLSRAITRFPAGSGTGRN